MMASVARGQESLKRWFTFMVWAVYAILMVPIIDTSLHDGSSNNLKWQNILGKRSHHEEMYESEDLPRFQRRAAPA